MPEMDKHQLDRAYKGAVKKAAQNNQRALSMSADKGSFTGDEWLAVCAEYDEKCALCGHERALTPDHIIPLTSGGPNTIDNIQPLCHPCNIAKRRVSMDYRVYDILAFQEAIGPVGTGSTGSAVVAYKAPRVISREQLLMVEHYLGEAWS